MGKELSEKNENIASLKKQESTSKLLYETRSREFEDIIGKTPSWVIRWGVVVVGAIIGSFILLSFFLEYPDIIPAKLLITSTTPPVEVFANNNGRIKEIIVKEFEFKKKGDVLAVLENAGDYQETEAIKVLMEELELDSNLYIRLKQLKHQSSNQFGELGQSYSSFETAANSYILAFEDGLYNIKINQLQSQIQQSELLATSSIKNLQMISEKFLIDKKNFYSDSVLYSKKAITDYDFTQAKKNWIDIQLNFENSRQSIQNSLLIVDELKGKLIELIKTRNKEIYESKRKVTDCITKLLLEIKNWERQYLLIAPVDGKVNFFKVWKESQFVVAGEGVFIIVPPSNDIIAKGFVSIRGSGKVMPGQKILIKLDSYPSNEFGQLTGFVSAISSVPMDSLYYIDISLPNKLKTSTGHQIVLTSHLTAQAEIITNNKTIMARIFSTLKGS